MDRLHQISNGFIQAKILLAAAELRVFEALAGKGATAGEVRRRIGGRQRGTEILLDALTAMEILDKRDDVYRLRSEYAPFLTEDSPTHLPAMLRHRNRMFRAWAHLEERIRGELPSITDLDRSVIEDREANENFIRAMVTAGWESVRLVADHVDLRGVRTLADLGGGPGHYLAELASRSGDLEPYLIDLPLTLDVARRILADSPVRDRIRMVPWNFYEEEAPESLPSFDLVFVSQVVHAEAPERNRELFHRLHRLVARGGRVVVHEKIVSRDRTSPLEAALFAVNMLAMTSGGRTYTEDEILSWGREAGFAPEAGERIDERSFLVRMRRER